MEPCSHAANEIRKDHYWEVWVDQRVKGGSEQSTSVGSWHRLEASFLGLGLSLALGRLFLLVSLPKLFLVVALYWVSSRNVPNALRTPSLLLRQYSGVNFGRKRSSSSAYGCWFIKAYSLFSLSLSNCAGYRFAQLRDLPILRHWPSSSDSTKRNRASTLFIQLRHRRLGSPYADAPGTVSMKIRVPTRVDSTHALIFVRIC